MTPYEWVKTVVLIALGYALISVGIAVQRLTTAWESVPGHITSTLSSFSQVGPQATSTLRTLDAVGKQATASLKVTDKVGKVLDGALATLDGVNRPCNVWVEVPSAAADEGVQVTKPCGTLADVNRTLATVRGTVGQIEVAARHENSNLTNLDAQEKQLYTDVHTTTTNLNALVASPDIARFLKSSADTSMQVNLIAIEGAGIAKDLHKEADVLTAPKPWYTKLGAYSTTGVNIACLVTHSCPF